MDAVLERVEVSAKNPIKAYAIIGRYGCIHPFKRLNDVLFISTQENSRGFAAPLSEPEACVRPNAKVDRR